MATSTSVRNNQVVQTDTYADRTVQKIVTGKRLAVQLAGYKWLPGVHADELGMKFESLSAVRRSVLVQNLFKMMLFNYLQSQEIPSEKIDFRNIYAFKLFTL